METRDPKRADPKKGDKVLLAVRAHALRLDGRPAEADAASHAAAAAATHEADEVAARKARLRRALSGDMGGYRGH